MSHGQKVGRRSILKSSFALLSLAASLTGCAMLKVNPDIAKPVMAKQSLPAHCVTDSLLKPFTSVCHRRVSPMPPLLLELCGGDDV